MKFFFKKVLFLHHLVEILYRNLLFVELNSTLEGCSQLTVDRAIYQCINRVTLLENLVSIVLDILLWNVCHTILSELCTSCLLSGLLDILVVHLDILSLDELLLDEVPCQLLDALLVVLLYELLTLILVVSQHDALQECIWECQLANLLLAVLAYIEDELVVRVVNQLLLQALSDLSTESSLVLHVSILTEYLLEELLVNLVLLEALDLCDLEAELRLQVSNSLTLDLQERRNLCIVLWVSLLRVESDYITHLSVIEEILLLLYLDVTRHQDSTLNSDTTFLGVTVLVELTDITLQKVVLLILLALLVATCTLSVHLYLLVEDLVANLDVIVINLVATVESYLELRCNSDVMASAPMLVETVYNDMKRGRVSRLNGLWDLCCSSAALDPRMLLELAQNGFVVNQCYGMTETFGDGILNFTQVEKHMSAVGKPDDHVQYKLDETGEICIKGDCVMLGYYKDPEATAEVIDADGWFHTGDLARMDEEGFYYITGRKKNLIILASGENVSPEELEKKLALCPAITECIVKEKSQKICAVIYCPEDKQEEVRAFVTEANRSLPLYKRISAVEFTAEPLPRNALGKLLRK